MSGPNGAGKTNILEALSLLSGWGVFSLSPLTSKLSSVINRGKGEAWLRANIEGEESLVSSAHIKSRCSLKLGGKAVKAAEIRARAPVLCFTPNSMQLLEGGASHRRALLDTVGALIYPPYAYRLYQYKQALRQRTACLRCGESDFLTLKVLVPLGVWLWQARADLTRRIGEYLPQESENLGCPLTMSYTRGGSGGIEDAKEDFISSTQRLRTREMAAKGALVGPHRDDLIFLSNCEPAASRLSRGLRKKAAVSVMLAAADAVHKALKRKPILLLDEVTSELDPQGKSEMLTTLNSKAMQVFAASAEDVKTLVNPGIDATIHVINQGMSA